MKNTSDSIEAYIKQLIAQTGFAEIQRSRLADDFSVVPSQINYVLKTRFNAHQGYLVESKRGGGGYIRIVRVEYSDQHQLVQEVLESIGQHISQTVFMDIMQLLYERQVLTQREGNILLAATTDDVLGEEASAIRANMLREILQRIDRKG